MRVDRVEASPKTETIQAFVLDGDGEPHSGAFAVACPFVGGLEDCSQLTRAQANPRGLAVLRLDSTVTYSVFAVIADPEPAWACPGLMVGDQELYLSGRIEAQGSALPRTVAFTIAEPSAEDCVVVAVTEDSGNPLPTAGLFLCGRVAGSAECVEGRFEGPDPDGVIRIAVDRDLVCDLGPFIADAGWPCPGFVSDDGTEFHFGPTLTVTVDELLAGVTLVIPRPSAEDCG